MEFSPGPVFVEEAPRNGRPKGLKQVGERKGTSSMFPGEVVRLRSLSPEHKVKIESSIGVIAHVEELPEGSDYLHRPVPSRGMRLGFPARILFFAGAQ